MRKELTGAPKKGAPDRRPVNSEKVLNEYDATTLVGLKTIVIDAAIERIDEDGERTIEVPSIGELSAAVSVVRCLTPVRLKGAEIKAIRRIMGMTMAELAKALDERTAAETVARWESDAQPMGGYAEKILRLVVCERLRERAPGVQYTAGMIADMRVIDPARVEEGIDLPAVVMRREHVREQDGAITEAYMNTKMAA